jgi:hypothetical protein
MSTVRVPACRRERAVVRVVICAHNVGARTLSFYCSANCEPRKRVAPTDVRPKRCTPFNSTLHFKRHDFDAVVCRTCGGLVICDALRDAPSASTGVTTRQQEQHVVSSAAADGSSGASSGGVRRSESVSNVSPSSSTGTFGALWRCCMTCARARV